MGFMGRALSRAIGGAISHAAGGGSSKAGQKIIKGIDKAAQTAEAKGHSNVAASLGSLSSTLSKPIGGGSGRGGGSGTILDKPARTNFSTPRSSTDLGHGQWHHNYSDGRAQTVDLYHQRGVASFSSAADLKEFASQRGIQLADRHSDRCYFQA